MSITDYSATIGLEVHCQLSTRTKLFSPCPYTYPAPPNSLTDAYTLGLPGELPVVDRRAVEYGLRLALAVGATPSPRSVWTRKHYFYPDLPKGYQISQGDPPLALGGAIDLGDRSVPLIRIHLEEDAGKLIHDADEHLVDFNRAGVPLLEIVGAPALRSPAEAAAYLRELRAIVRALEISDATMETGSLRCDANVSLHPRGRPGHGTRCEIKNLNSFKFLERALTAEIQRQADLLDAGTPITSVTLGYDPGADRVHIQRTKESALDYRYLPEPDLPPLLVDDAWLARLKSALPELPRARRARYVELGLTPADAATITADPELSAYFDAALARAPDHARKLSHWLLVDLLGRLHAADLSPARSPVPPEQLAELVALVDGDLGPQQGRELLARCWAERRAPREILADGWFTAASADEITAAVAAVLTAHPRQRASYLAGKTALRGFFVGQILRALAGRADPQRVHAALDRLLADG